MWPTDILLQIGQYKQSNQPTGATNKQRRDKMKIVDGAQVWDRGEKTDKIAELLEAVIRASKYLHLTQADAYTEVQKAILSKNLDINLYPSLIRVVATAEKRKFCFLRTPDKGLILTMEHGILLDILSEKARCAKVLRLPVSPSDLRRVGAR
jgi:hypothetical protein